MIVAVTGSSGFIGKKLLYELELCKHEVISLDLTVGINILDWDVIKNTRRFDVLVHLAAMSYVPESYEKPREFYNVNVNGVINCLELCRKYNAKFIFASSYVYGIPQFLPITENHSLVGFNPYAETKIIGEKICADYFKYFNVRSIILRPFNIYGKGQKDNFLIPLILKQAKTGTLNLLDSRPKRDFIHVNDVIEAFKKAVENNSIEFDQFNVGYGKSYSVKQVVNIVNEMYDNKLIVKFSKNEREHEVLDTIADISKIKIKLNWEPTIGIERGLRWMIDL